MVKLEVYLSDGCWTCGETRQIVADVAPEFPEVVVRLIEIDGQPLPESVFAVPTYLVNGRVVSLGNPTREELRQKLLHVLYPAAA